ncbi:MAG: AMP-binding protein [Thiotrichales bacterium]|nr:AMP-binding protein [Thiotrichales bacterium]
MNMLPVDARRIGECVGFHAAREPDREAAVDGATRLAYRDLDRAVARWAKALLAAGVTRGDRVASLTPPSTEWLTIMLAATEVGAVWTGYHPRYRMPEFRHVTQLAEPTVLIAFRHIHGRDYAEELTALMRENASVRSLVTLDEPLDGATPAPEFLAGGGAASDRGLAAARRSVGLDDTAVLIFTSGTTGRPKAAMITHRALLTGAAVENEHWPMERPRLLHMMPVNHIAGVGMVGVFGLYVGGTLVFQDRFDPGDLLRLLEEERIDHVLGSPVQFHMMANHPDFGSRDLSRLKFVTWGGAPMAADLVARLHALPGELRTSYGMTELGLYVTYSEPGIGLDTLSRTIGKPHPGFDIRIADATGTVARPGEQGEIQARGDWLLAGYFRDPEATADAYTADGWFRTGDVVQVWPDGNLEIVGRTKEMFISGGFNIYPREIEIVIEAHPDAGLVAVLGVPDATFGEVGHAFVEPKPGRALNAATLHAWCRERLANYKTPKCFEIRPELPRLPIGKIDKQTLKRELSERRG